MRAFALLWFVALGIFDFHLFGGIFQQVRALSYARTEGQLLESRVEEHSDSDGSTYSAKVAYRYEIGSQQFRGERRRYAPVSTSGNGAHRWVRSHPAGSKITVYYDPSNPSESVLEPGVQGVDLLLLMFLTPFHLIGLRLWVESSASRQHPDTGGVEVVRQGPIIVARLSDNTPLKAFFSTLAIGTFGGIFVVALLFGFDASTTTVSLVWGCLLLAGAWRAQQAQRDLRAGVGDLVLSPGPYLECWPLLRRPPQRVRVYYQDIADVEIREEEVSDGDGGATIAFAVELLLKDGSRHRLRNWSDASPVGFQSWLKGQLGNLAATT